MNEESIGMARGLLLEEITLQNICSDGKEKQVCYWAPRREEIQRFVELTKRVHKLRGSSRQMPVILSIGCGSGFLEYLLALTGEVKVIGIDPDEDLIINTPYSHPNLQLEVGDSKDAVRRYRNEVRNDDCFFMPGKRKCTKVDVVLSSWMPSGINLTPDIRDINAPGIIYVRDLKGSTGICTCEDDTSVEDEEISYETGPDYEQAFEWLGPSWDKVMRFSNGIVPRSALDEIVHRDNNLVDIQLRRDVSRSIPVEMFSFPAIKKYSWEEDMEDLFGSLEPAEKAGQRW